MLTLPIHNKCWAIGLHEVSLGIANSERIIFLTGAGISCSSGIQDFTSPGGLFEKYGRQVFSANSFQHTKEAAAHFKFVSAFKAQCDQAQPSVTHQFITKLAGINKLLRCYTQNVDGLEIKAGMDAFPEKLVQLHGSIHFITCSRCYYQREWDEEVTAAFSTGASTGCTHCLTGISPRKLSGLVRADILLYDESNIALESLIRERMKEDIKLKPDMLVIVGTSLSQRVTGIMPLVTTLASQVHKVEGGLVVYVNKTPPPAPYRDVIDYHLVGDADHWVKTVVGHWETVKHKGWREWNVASWFR